MRLVSSVAIVACLLPACPPALGAQQPIARSVPAMVTAVGLAPDSAYATVRARLQARGYRLDTTDATSRRLVVRPPRHSTSVEVRITSTGDSSSIAFLPLDAPTSAAQLRAILTVTHDAMFETPSAARRPPTESPGLPDSRWRPELFVTPGGRFWLATGGLYTADSSAGPWRLVMGGVGSAVDPDALRIGVNMAFVGEDTALLGLPGLGTREEGGSLLFRTTNRGGTWTPVATAEFQSIDEVAAVGRSVWLFASQWEQNRRQAVFMNSPDAGQTWVRTELPPQLGDVTRLYRVSPSVGYVATAGSHSGPVFWRTEDSGRTWAPVPTPRDQGVHRVPSYGTRIEEIASLGGWLLVREYGRVFVTRPDTVRWRPLDHADRIAVDLERDELFVLTDAGQAQLLDGRLNQLWSTAARIPPSKLSDADKVLVRHGVGYVSMGHGEIYVARIGTLEVVRPAGQNR